MFDGDPTAAYDAIASSAWAAGAMISTAGDLHTFLTGLFGGELISDAALTEMTTTEPDEYGLGLGMLRLPSGLPAYGHDGDIVGYLSFVAFEPDSGGTVIVLSNNNDVMPFDLANEVLADW